MPKDGQRKRIIFTHLDKRGKPVAADDSAYECLNCIIGRDAVVRPRPSAKLEDAAASNLVTMSNTSMPLYISPFVSSPTPAEDRIEGFAYVNFKGDGDNKYSMITSNGYIFTDLGTAGAYLFYINGAGLRPHEGLTPPYYSSAFGSGFSYVIYDSSSAGFSPGAYKEIFYTTGNLIQRVKLGHDAFTQTTAMLPSGTNPAYLDIISRANIITVHRGQAFYSNDEAPNFLWYSKNQTAEGAPQYDKFAEGNEFIRVGSGTGDGIRSLISFGDSVYVFTNESVWRLTGNLGEVDGSGTRFVKILDVGCPSRQGIEYISSSTGGAEAKDSSGGLAFLTSAGDFIISDGISGVVVSDPVAPTLKKLTAGQIGKAIVTRMDEAGYLAVLWPSPGYTKTYGLVYDYFLNRWAGELEYDFIISSADYHNVAGNKNVYASVNTGVECYGYRNTMALTSTLSKGGVVKLFSGTDTRDLYWRKKSSPPTAASDYDFYDAVGLGNPYRKKLKSQDMDMGSPGIVKRVTGVIYEMEPISDGNINLQLYADSNPNPKNWAFRQAGEDSNQYGVVAVEDAVYNTSIGRARKKFVIDSGERVISGFIGVGCEVEPGKTGSVTIYDHDAANSTTVSNIADRGAFVVHSIELVYNAERDFGAPTYGSSASG